jgi:hypothetical protein
MQMAELLREPVDAVVLGVSRSRWFVAVLLGSAAVMLAVVVALDLGIIGYVVGAMVVLAVTAAMQRQVFLARTPTRIALVTARRAGLRPSKLARVVQPGDVTFGSAGPTMRTFTVDGTTYLVSKLYSTDLDRVLEPR